MTLTRPGTCARPAPPPRRRCAPIAATVTALLIAVSAATAGTAAADPAAPTRSPGYSIGPFTHSACEAAAAHNSSYFRAHGGGNWNYSCHPGRGGWFYNSPYVA